MKLISTEFGQSFQPYLLEELRPLNGGLYLPGLIAAVADRYKFASVPTINDALQQGAKFAEGFLLVNGQIISIRQLGIYNDGMIVVAWNTDESDLILEEVMTWATQTFRLREPITRTRRVYISSVVVEFDFSIERAFHTLSEFIRIYEAALKSAYDWEFPIEPTRITFGADPTKMPQHRSADFLIERRAGRSFPECRYFSSVPLRTSAHVDLLARLETVIREIRI
jgi:hypothetical protein